MKSRPLTRAPDRLGIAHVGVVDRHLVGDLAHVERVAAVIRDQGVDDRHLGAELDQACRQVGADEARAHP